MFLTEFNNGSESIYRYPAPRPRRSLAETPPRSVCPLACALDLLGDRWTLLVLRDALCFEKALFQEFLDSPEGISSNTLTERLKRLERHGLLVRGAQAAPVDAPRTQG